jgi:uncharacterized protein (DUF1499 family)
MSENIHSGHQSTPFHGTSARRRASIGPRLVQAAWLTLALAVICALSELLAGPAYRIGLIALSPGLQTMRWAASAAAVVFAMAAIAAWLASRQRANRAKAIFLLSSIIGLLAAAPPAFLWYRVQHLPHIHDISTDTVNPPQYFSVLPLREGAPNSTRYDFKLAPLQLQAYPDVSTTVLAAPPDQAFRKALRVAGDMGWKIVDANQSALRIEATDTSLLFGFRDDVVVRISAAAGGSRIDLRSLSRVGGSDFGVNAKRIRGFIARLKEAGT